MVPNDTPRVYATVTAHVNRELSIRMVKGPAAAERGTALIMHNEQQQSRSLLPHPASWHRDLLIPKTASRDTEEEGEEEEVWQSEKAHNAPEGNKSVTVPDSGNRRQKDPFFLAAFGHFFLFFNVGFCLFSNSYLCEHFCCWAVGYMFIRKHLFVYARCRAQGDDGLKINLHSLTDKDQWGHSRVSLTK